MNRAPRRRTPKHTEEVTPTPDIVEVFKQCLRDHPPGDHPVFGGSAPASWPLIEQAISERHSKAQ